jgi:spore maturation protein CgeB
MKVLVIGAGASYSTADVEAGVVDGLRAEGVEVALYPLDRRISASSAFLNQCWRTAKKQGAGAEHKPTTADVLLHAVQDSLTKALLHDVDWVLVVSSMFVPRPFVEVMKRAGLRVALLFTESPYDLEREMLWAEQADIVWTNERTSAPALRRVCPRSFYLPHAMRPEIHKPFDELDATMPAHDVVFVGTAFQERIELLEAIDWTGIDLGLYGQWRELGRSSPLRPFVRGGVTDNVKTAALYRRARIGLNLYRQSMGWGKNARRITCAESLNPRAYELAACGCFHVSDARPEVREVFGDLVPTFKTAAECESLIHRWLADDAGRAKVAAALPQTVREHTWQARAAAMMPRFEPAAVEALERQIAALRARLDKQGAAA